MKAKMILLRIREISKLTMKNIIRTPLQARAMIRQEAAHSRIKRMGRGLNKGKGKNNMIAVL
jgi:hypothetical protein